MNINSSIRELLAGFVAQPQQLHVEESTLPSGVKSIVIRVAPEDIKRVIGNGGRNFRSIRTLIRSALRDFTVEMTVDVGR